MCHRGRICGYLLARSIDGAIDDAGLASIGRRWDQAALPPELNPHVGKAFGAYRSHELARFRDAEAVGSNGLDEAVSRFDHQSAVAIDQARLAVDVDLREAELVVADDAIARRHNLVSVLVDEAIEVAGADGGTPVGERADPIIARRHGNAPVAAHRAAEAAGKCAH